MKIWEIRWSSWWNRAIFCTQMLRRNLASSRHFIRELGNRCHAGLLYYMKCSSELFANMENILLIVKIPHLSHFYQTICRIFVTDPLIKRSPPVIKEIYQFKIIYWLSSSPHGSTRRSPVSWCRQTADPSVTSCDHCLPLCNQEGDSGGCCPFLLPTCISNARKESFVKIHLCERSGTLFSTIEKSEKTGTERTCWWSWISSFLCSRRYGFLSCDRSTPASKET